MRVFLEGRAVVPDVPEMKNGDRLLKVAGLGEGGWSPGPMLERSEYAEPRLYRIRLRLEGCRQDTGGSAISQEHNKAGMTRGRITTATDRVLLRTA
jgi:hypothetical protein